MKNKIDNIYTLEELIISLEKMAKGNDQSFNIGNAFLSICYEIDKIKEFLVEEHDFELD